MRNCLTLIVVSAFGIALFLAGCLYVSAQSRRETVPTTPAIDTSDVSPELYQELLSYEEERREVTDFLVAPAELIQQSLNGKEVLCYDQN